jgi:hypothetical protein
MPKPTPYDRIGSSYTTTRGEEPRIARAIREALADAHTVLNVGAGTGSYEPHDREVVAVEPSAVMVAQRPPDAAPVVQARAGGVLGAFARLPGSGGARGDLAMA